MRDKTRQLLLRVTSMAGEDGDLLPSLHTPQQIENFLDLIVLECANIVDTFDSVRCESFHREDGSKIVTGDIIKKHFGSYE